MKAICERQELLQALSSLSRIVPSRPSSPILGGCLLFTGDEAIVLQGTDLDLSLTVRVPAEVYEHGSFVVPIRHFLDLVRRLPEGNVGLEWGGRGSRLEVRYREGASVKLDVWDAEEFPNLQPRALDNGMRIEGGLWKNLTKRVVFSAAAREIRPNYAGVYLEVREGELALVSTDTYRLSVLRMPYAFESLPEGGIIIPTQAINEAVRLSGDEEQLELTWDKRVVSFQGERFVLTNRLIDARFPAYESVIPESSDVEIFVDKSLLEQCLERASLFVEPNERFAVAEMRVSGGLMRISAEAAQVGSLYEEIPVECEWNGECVAYFNTRFLLEPLRAIEQQRIKICLNGSGGPLIYLEEMDFSYLHLVLPVRKSEGAASE